MQDILNWKKCFKLTSKDVTSRECQMKRNCDDKVVLKALVQTAWQVKI